MTTDPALLKPATLTAKAPDVYEVTLKTTKGDIVVQVTRSWAPIGADRFYNLVKHGFYNGAAFFRIVPGFVVQFGLSGDPAVNKAWKNANIKDDPVTQSNKPGMLVFATAGPNTRTTQLFINLGNNAPLDGQGFAPFGQVTSGMDVVQKLYAGYGERPDQGAITSEGKAYIDKNFPMIDKILTATITAPATTHTGAPAASAPKH
jgi:peptidyl-prolyl cis-trans isomerase A (cyclophilin A)